MTDRFDIEARRRGNRSHDQIKLTSRDYVFDASEAVRRSLLCGLHRGFRSQIPVSQDDVIYYGPTLRVAGRIVSEPSHRFSAGIFPLTT
jgi:hypothetical protein